MRCYEGDAILSVRGRGEGEKETSPAGKYLVVRIRLVWGSQGWKLTIIIDHSVVEVGIRSLFVSLRSLGLAVTPRSPYPFRRWSIPPLYRSVDPLADL